MTPKRWTQIIRAVGPGGEPSLQMKIGPVSTEPVFTLGQRSAIIKGYKEWFGEEPHHVRSAALPYTPDDFDDDERPADD